MQIKSIMRYHLTPIRITNIKKSTENKCWRGLPWWLSGKESACECRTHGFNPWSKKIPHASEPLNLCPRTIESELESPGAANTDPTRRNYWSPLTLEPRLLKRNNRNEKPTHYNERAAPLLSVTEESLCSDEDPAQPKLNEQIHKIKK